MKPGQNVHDLKRKIIYHKHLTNMAKSTITVQGIEIRLDERNKQDYVCITDIAKTSDQPTGYTIRNWLRNRSTVEFLGLWEQLHNENFNVVEFDYIKMKTGLNNFSWSQNDWIEKIGAIGLTSNTGRYGGTYAHLDIAINFCNWFNVEFYLYFVKEFRLLKEAEEARLGKKWDLRRELAKANYAIHTDAIRENIVPMIDWRTKREAIFFASEADLLNVAVFGTTAKQWKAANPESKGNLRDSATVEELQVLANMESLNAALIGQGFNQVERLSILAKRAEREVEVLKETKAIQAMKKIEAKK